MDKQFTKEDLAQMDRAYFVGLEHDTLVGVACSLRDLCVDVIERLDQNSRNSSRPPSSDNPYDKGEKGEGSSKDDDGKDGSTEDKDKQVAQSSESTDSPRQPETDKRPLEDSLALKGFGGLRLRWLKKRFLTTQSIARSATKNLLCQSKIQRIWDITFTNLRRLIQGFAYSVRFTSTIQQFVVAASKQRHGPEKVMFHLLRDARKTSKSTNTRW